MVLSHPDFRGSGALSGNFSAPSFRLTRVGSPRYMLLLENSHRMNSRGQWDFLRTAARDLVMRGLPSNAHLGVILFNEAAHVAHPLALLGEVRTRQSIALQIKSKHALSPSHGSCVQCAVARAVESLGEDGVLVLISRAPNVSLDLLPLLVKHRLQLFSIALPDSVETAAGSKSLERLAHASGGSSDLVVSDTLQDDDSPPISYFVALQDALRDVLQRTLPLSPFLIHESDYLSFEEGRDRKVGHFVVDRFARRETQFRVYFRDQLESYIRALTVDSEVGNSYSTIMDSMVSQHYLGVYDVPYDEPGNAGLAWRYSLDRLPSPRRRNSHIVQVTSQAPSDQEELEVKVTTNLVGHIVNVNLEQPLILFVEVRQAGQAVSGARVLCDLQLVEGETGREGTTFTLELSDNGAGDPDLQAGDGVYSKYMSRLAGPGLYKLRIQVLSNQDFPAMVKTREGYEGTSLGPFTRIIKGNSFRVLSIAPHYRARVPPSRILDLSVSVVSSSQQLEFSWSAPGCDYDEGRPTSYLLYQSTDPALFTGTALPPSLLVESFSGVRGAGGKEAHRSTVC